MLFVALVRLSFAAGEITATGKGTVVKPEGIYVN
jgi:hypothetical protein